MLVDVSGAEWLGMPNHTKAYLNSNGLIVITSVEGGEVYNYDWDQIIIDIVPCMQYLLTPSKIYDHIIFNWSNRYGEYVFHCHKFYPYLSNSGENAYIEVTFSEALNDGWLDEYGTLASDYELFTRMPLFARYQSNVYRWESDDSEGDMIGGLVELASVEFDFNEQEQQLEDDGIFSTELEHPIPSYPHFQIENVLEQRNINETHHFSDEELGCVEPHIMAEDYDNGLQHGPVAGNPLRMPDLNDELTQTSKI